MTIKNKLNKNSFNSVCFWMASEYLGTGSNINLVQLMQSNKKLLNF